MSKPFNPLVSIVIPVYNGSNYMREAIDSALAQTYKNIEVIVVNDGSTDNTDEIAKSYGKKIRYFKQKNGGVASALNKAIKNSKGEYISWLSHDDMYTEDKIEKQIAELSKLSSGTRHKTIMWSNYKLINEASAVTSVQAFQTSHDERKFNNPLYPILNGIVHGCTLLIPKKCFEDTGYFNVKLKTTQDYDLWFKMFPKYDLVFMKDSFVLSRWHDDQGSKTIEGGQEEADELWIKMIKILTDEEKNELAGSVIEFNANTLTIMEGANYKGAASFINEQIEQDKKRDSSKILVSVIIPFFNRVGLLLKSVESVLEQTHTNFELILVNDNSTDDISSVKKLAKSDKRIKLISNSRTKGASGARNTGLDETTGEYIAFLDSDDTFKPEKIEKQLKFMLDNSALASHTSYSLIDSSGSKTKVNSGANNMVYPSVIIDAFAATPTIMTRLELFKENRFNEKFHIGEDISTWIDLSKRTDFYGLNDHLTIVRKHEGSAAFNKDKQKEGLNNILNHLIDQHLSKDTLPFVVGLNNAFVKRGGEDKRQQINKKLFTSDNLQISDNDLIGNKFNGHDLHNYLNDRGIDSRQLVWHKESQDEKTYQIARDKHDRLWIYDTARKLQKRYYLDSIMNPIGYDLLYDPAFLNARLVHMHLIHNHIFDLQLLPIMSRLKPMVWTLHDPWAFGGHSVHPQSNSWRTLVKDSKDLDAHFPLDKDNTTLNFLMKRDAVNNSNIEIIVASKWMKRMAEQSPVFRDKNIHYIPFGIDQSIFKPLDKKKARKSLGIRPDATVILFRCDYSEFKGIGTVLHTINNIKSNKPIVLLTVKDKLKTIPKGMEAKEFGWVSDDGVLAQIYSASDIFLTPSEHESFGLMAVEAMSCGALPIATEGTALPEVINAPECGVVTSRDKDRYLEKVQHFINNEEERNDRAAKCIEYSHNEYQIDRYLDQIEKVYEKAQKNHTLSDENSILLGQLQAYVSPEPSFELMSTLRPAETSKTNKLTIIARALRNRSEAKRLAKKIITRLSPTVRISDANSKKLDQVLSSNATVNAKTDQIYRSTSEDIKDLTSSINELKRDYVAQKHNIDISASGDTLYNYPLERSKVEHHLPIEEFLEEMKKYIIRTDIVADVGSGIRPQIFFEPKVHICIEPFERYRKVIRPLFPNRSYHVSMKEGGVETLRTLDDLSIDTVFMLDVIEHLDKAEGEELLREAMRVARRQVVVFTPLGFYPMHFELDGQKDAWGLEGNEVQKHRSGWTPEDFRGNWSFHICVDCHDAFLPEEKKKGIRYSSFMAILTKDFKDFPLDNKTPEFIKATHNRRIINR